MLSIETQSTSSREPESHILKELEVMLQLVVKQYYRSTNIELQYKGHLKF